MTNKNYYQESLKSMLEEFSNIPITDNDEIEESFMHFEAGTDRFEVLKWFDERLDEEVVETIEEQKFENINESMISPVNMFEEISFNNKKKSSTKNKSSDKNKEKKTFKELRKEINSLYCQLEQIKNNISKLTQECVDRFAIFDPGNEIYSNSPFQSKNKTACKIRIKDIKLNRTKDGLWFWTATGSYIKNDGSEGSLIKSFSTTKFK